MNKKSIDKLNDLEYVLNQILAERIASIVNTIADPNKSASTVALIKNYISDFSEKTKIIKQEDYKKEFNRLVNDVMSVIEIIGLDERQFKSTRRLILKEIYDCEKNFVFPIVSKGWEIK